MAKNKGKKRIPGTRPNPFVNDPNHVGEMTVMQLVELVCDRKEFPRGLDTRICVGDVEGNFGVNPTLRIVAHKPGDVILAIYEHGGDMNYDPDEED
jgi:hypothetical protein